MSEMIERVAEAIMKHATKGMFEAADWIDQPDYVREIWRGAARAAIEAMREPTAAMLNVGPPEPYMDADVWAKMINAALNDGTASKGEGK